MSILLPKLALQLEAEARGVTLSEVGMNLTFFRIVYFANTKWCTEQFKEAPGTLFSPWGHGGRVGEGGGHGGSFFLSYGKQRRYFQWLSCFYPGWLSGVFVCLVYVFLISFPHIFRSLFSAAYNWKIQEKRNFSEWYFILSCMILLFYI